MVLLAHDSSFKYTRIFGAPHYLANDGARTSALVMVKVLETMNKWGHKCSLHVHSKGFTFYSAHANPHLIDVEKATVTKLRIHWFSFSGKALTLRQASAYIARLHAIAKQGR